MSNIDFNYIDKDLEIIDISRKGYLVRFYLGKKEGEWGYTNPNYKDYKGQTPDWLKPSDIYYGDDWDDTPYEYNAGTVYEWFVKGYIDIAIGWECRIIEPHSGVLNNEYSKEDFVNKKVPALIILPKDFEIPSNYYEPDEDGKYKDEFSFFNELKDTKIAKIYYGDSVKKLLKISEREDM